MSSSRSTYQASELDKTLIPVFAALRGWAYARDPLTYVAQAERKVLTLPIWARDEAWKVIGRVREAILIKTKEPSNVP